MTSDGKGDLLGRQSGGVQQDEESTLAARGIIRVSKDTTDSNLARVVKYASELPAPILELLIALARHTASLKWAVSHLEGQLELRNQVSLSQAQVLGQSLQDLYQSLVNLREIDFGMKKKDHIYFEGSIDNELAKVAKAIDALNQWHQVQTDPALIFEREELERVNVSYIIEKAISSLDPSLGVSRIKIIDVAPTSMISTAPERLALAVAELLDNALRYSSGEVEILAGANEDQEIWIEIADRGPGLQGKEPEVLISPLSRRTKEQTFGQSDGLAMGLYLAKTVADSLNGALELVEREDGTGLYARLFLPQRRRGEIN